MCGRCARARRRTGAAGGMRCCEADRTRRRAARGAALVERARIATSVHVACAERGDRGALLELRRADVQVLLQRSAAGVRRLGTIDVAEPEAASSRSACEKPSNTKQSRASAAASSARAVEQQAVVDLVAQDRQPERAAARARVLRSAPRRVGLRAMRARSRRACAAVIAAARRGETRSRPSASVLERRTRTGVAPVRRTADSAASGCSDLVAGLEQQTTCTSRARSRSRDEHLRGAISRARRDAALARGCDARRAQRPALGELRSPRQRAHGSATTARALRSRARRRALHDVDAGALELERAHVAIARGATSARSPKATSASATRRAKPRIEEGLNRGAERLRYSGISSDACTVHRKSQLTLGLLRPRPLRSACRRGRSWRRRP